MRYRVDRRTWFFKEYPLPSLNDLIGLAILSFATAKNLSEILNVSAKAMLGSPAGSNDG